MVDHSNLRLLIDAVEAVLAPSPEPEVGGPVPFAVPDPLPAPPIVYSSEIADWYYFGKGLRTSFRDACRLAFRAGLQEIPNRESLRLVDEGIRLHRLLGDAMPTVDRSREDNIHELSVLEAQCNEYKEAVLMATSAYDIVLDLESTIEISDSEPGLDGQVYDDWYMDSDSEAGSAGARSDVGEAGDDAAGDDAAPRAESEISDGPTFEEDSESEHEERREPSVEILD